MKRIDVIILLCYAAFAAQFMLYNIFGSWGTPELMLLVVVFFNLYLGIRYSIIAAVICGVLQDTIAATPMGTHLLVYIAGAYAATFIRRYLYQPGSRFSRAMVAFFAVLACFAVRALLNAMDHQTPPGELVYLLFPQLIATMVAATYVFHRLRDISVFFKLRT